MKDEIPDKKNESESEELYKPLKIRRKNVPHAIAMLQKVSMELHSLCQSVLRKGYRPESPVLGIGNDVTNSVQAYQVVLLIKLITHERIEDPYDFLLWAVSGIHNSGNILIALRSIRKELYLK